MEAFVYELLTRMHNKSHYIHTGFVWLSINAVKRHHLRYLRA